MATKKPERGTRDPFRKWSGTAEAFASINTPLAAAKDLLADLTRQMASPGLGSQGRAVLAKEISKAKQDISRYEREGRAALKTMQDQQRLQLDIIYKLNALRSQMAKKDVDPEIIKLLAINEKKLEDLLLLTRKVDLENMGDLIKKVHESQKSLEELPDELADLLTGNDSITEKLLEKQQEAIDFLKTQKEDFAKFRKDLKKSIKDGIVNTAAKVADSIGIGPFTLGNLGRVARGVYRGGKYLARTAVAQYRSRKDYAGKEEEKVGRQSLTEKFFEYAAHTRLFQRRMMLSADKKDQSDRSLLSFLPSLKGLLGGVGKFFGTGGVIATLLSRFGGVLGKKVLPMLGGLLRGGLRVLGPLGALAGAFTGGHWVGTKIYEMFSEPIAKAVDYFFFKNPETGKTGLEQAFADAMSKGKELYEGATKAIVAGKEVVKEAVSKAWSNITGTAGAAVDAGKEMVGTGVDKAKEGYKTVTDRASAAVDAGKAAVASGAETVSTAVSNAGATARSVVNRGVEAVSSGGAKVRDWVGKIFSKGGNVDVDGLNPQMQKNMVDMAREYHEKTGKKLQLNSAYRSPEKQAELYRRLPKGQAAPPGRSLHEYGFAFDTQSAQGEELAKLGLLSKYGFDRPIKGEKWHVQPKGMNVAAAKAGIYSADAPSREGAVNATPVPQTVSPTEPTTKNAPIKTARNGNGSPSNMSPTGTIQPSTRIGVNDIPSYDMSDGQFLAANLGLAA